jgi:magnesium transporter
MHKLRYHKPGTPPATLVASRGQKGRKPVISLVEYDAHSLQERQVEQIEEVFHCLASPQVSWINIDGLGDIELLQKLGKQFRIHPLVLEDILNTGQRAKLDEFNHQFFVVIHMVYDNPPDDVVSEQVSLILGENYVITIQEEPGRDVFDPIRQRIREGCGNIRFMKADYLAYALIDAVTDNYFPVVESLGERMEAFQETLLEQPTRERLQELHAFKRAIARIRHAIWPQREVIGRLVRSESELIADRTKPFLRDCYDHTLMILDLIESFRDVTASIMDLYISSLSLRTNEIMRVLTVISAIFIPLTFIVGVYGMNFDPSVSHLNMPELKWAFGYPFVWIVMIAVATGMIFFFRRKKWL